MCQLLGTGCHTDGRDVTNTHYNGYALGGVYRLLKPMELAHDDARNVPSNYRICDDMPTNSPFVDGQLPAGTRIRFEKTVWAASHEGPGEPVAYGTILDTPFAPRLVNLIYLSDFTPVVGRAQPSTNLLVLEP